MLKPSEERLAKAAYNWLRISPLVTIPTLLFITSMNIAAGICGETNARCDYHTADTLNLTFGVLGSALWHLVLLQYINNKDSGFVRQHGNQAAVYAGIRTAVPLGGVILSYFTADSGALACIVIGILLLLWFTLPTFGMNQIKRELEANSEITRDEPKQPQQINEQNPHVPSTQVVGAEVSMSENETPEEVLNTILAGLRSPVLEDRSEAVRKCRELSYSSEAVRRQLEIIARQDDNKYVRADALAALNTPANRMVQKRINSNRLDRGTRYVILQEINEWEKNDLLESPHADLLRRRYDYDFESVPKPAAASAPQGEPAPTPKADSQPEAKAPAAEPAPPVERSEPVPQPSLIQTLTSEAAIRIYLYLGAFFVIAAATFVGWAIPEFRLPILFVGVFAFGGLSIAIKKRLPQPSFALFIVFSFLLVITANNLEDTLRDSLNFSDAVSAGYWVVVFLLMAGVWSVSTWLYESRLFSITSFGAFALSLYRIGDAFDAQPEFYTLMTGVAALAGLGGVWLVKRWRDEKFALPLFFATLASQGVTLVASISIFGIHLVDPANPSLWHLAAFFVWGLAAIFFILANLLYPFMLFPWFAAATLIPMPWFLAAAFDLETLGSTFVLLVWGAAFAIGSEVLHRIERTQKYSLPVLLASLPALALAIITGLAHDRWLGVGVLAANAIVLSALQVARARWWLWSLALLNFSGAYFLFFDLEFLSAINIHTGYKLFGIAALFLLPDLLLEKDWSAAPNWRSPLRVFGAAFVVYQFFAFAAQTNSTHIAVGYALFTLLTAVYALAYRAPRFGYIPAAFAALAVTFLFDALDSDGWLPALTALAVAYLLVGVALRSREAWSLMLRNSALALGSLTTLAALILTQETGGWYALVVGLLFIAEMYLRKNGLFELGAPILFSIGVFLILLDFDVDRPVYHFLAYSLIWILADLLAHLTFVNPRPLKWVVRGFGASLALLSYIALFTESDARLATLGFGIYALLFLIVSLLYRQPTLFYAFTLTVPLFVVFLFRIFDVTKWIHPVIVLAVMYYAAGFLLRLIKRAEGWDASLLYSGLGVGIIVSVAAPILGGLDAALPVAVAATLWAVEAFAKRSAWLAFPANGLYLLAYFVILGELNVDEPQFYSVGAALLGLIQHYLLVRAESRSGAFIMGMLSQFTLLGTTYIQMVTVTPVPEMFGYFVLLFFQSLVVLIYGIVIRSRSLTFFPIGFVVLGVITLSFLATGGLGTVFIVGCTGILMLGLGIAAVLMRERLSKLGERMSDWKP